jgi:hypothetical protein
MKKLAVLPLCLGCVLAVSNSHAIDLKASKVTQVVNDVEIISGPDQKQKSAMVNDIFSMPDILRTGTASRAELIAPDETVTRVGANTIFSFDPANRTIDLKQGSLLFHSPHGKGGGTIHTGSATASVLGTTLIVVTTPNGGMKVIDLEGSVQVKFPGGQKQKLAAGQMTFILTNGNQLAPVVVFRLDELTQNSLLVKGFSQPLQSLPLIQNQIVLQTKQIQSGQATDTKLYVGDDASPSQIQVLDVNTISHTVQPPPVVKPPPIVPDLATAEGADATINQASLTDASIPTPPYHVFTGTPFSLAGNNFFNGKTFSGFVARNIYVNTPAAALNPLSVDLSAYNGLGEFDIVALGNLDLEGSVTFNGLAAQDNLSLIGGGQLLLSPGIAVRADVKNFLLSTPGSLTLDGASLYNSANNIALNSGAGITFKNGALVNANGKLTVTAVTDISSTGSHFIANSATFTPLSGTVTFDSTTLDASSHAIFIAPTAIYLNNSTINSAAVTLDGSGIANISVNNTTINASSLLTAVTANALNVTDSTLKTDAGAGTVTLISSFGSTSVTGTSITAHYLTVNSGDGILLDANGQTLTATGSGATANFTAPNLITVNNADFSSFGVVNMAANTINLSSVAFGGTSAVTLKSLNGVLAPSPNTGAVSVPGDVNFINNVTYGGNPAQNYINSGITVTTLH